MSHALPLLLVACTLGVPLSALAQEAPPHRDTYDLRAHFQEADSYGHAATQLYVTSVLLVVPSAIGAALGGLTISFASATSSFGGSVDAGPWLVVAGAITAFVGHVLTMALAITYDVMSSARRADAMDHIPLDVSLTVLPSISADGAGLRAALTF